jgi:hypothetical protein
MSVFAKPVSQIVSEDLQDLLATEAVENVRLEFKRDVPSKVETLKKISSFANTYGGLMIVGAEADGADGRLIGLPGVDLQSGYKQTVMQWCFAGAAPPMCCEVSDPIPTPSGNSKVCYAVSVAESDTAPHFLNGRRGVYVRTDEFSCRFDPQLANEHELRHLLDRRQLIRNRRLRLIDRSRERLATFLLRPQTPAAAGRKLFSSRLELTLVPRFPAAPVCEHRQLLGAIKEVSVSWRQSAFPMNNYGAVSQHESAILLQPCGAGSWLEANIWGMLFYAAPIGEERRECTGIYTDGFIGYVLVFLRHARSMLQRVRYAGPLHIEVALHDIRDVPWISFSRGFAQAVAKSELDNTVVFALSSTTDDLQLRPDGLATEILQTIFFATNWPGVADSTEKLDAIIRAGYEYNSWRA